ncbi:type II toxin-antitoxin system RelE/ParE family toxin [Sulfidibacter corallicola]|uniref:Type II toxin-antitoxin system RelE/ParE family toxin n=1 Tax=Sulfidibacter corallicola TaxID=2818388 RepID=A0A8A4TIB0_SULCO|nr:type II toxin-antitoxin system RelE/ParE family toxin [Sulfidibacter corallicola]
MKVIWTPQAQKDRADIWNHIVKDKPGAAIRLDELFGDAASSLSHSPTLGRVGGVPCTRELIPHQRYRLVYEIHEGSVWILALVHTSRMWPPPQ